MEDKKKLHYRYLASIALFLLLFTLVPSVTASPVTCYVVDTNYAYWSNEHYPVIYIFGDKYVPLFTEGDQIWKYHVNKLAKPVRDDYIKYTIRAGDKLDLGEGYALEAKQIDVDSATVWLEFSKDGEYIDEQILSPKIAAPGIEVFYSSNWICKLDDIQGEDNVVVLRVHVNQVFQGAVDSIAQIEGLWLIDYENAMTLNIGDEIGEYTLEQIISGVDASNPGSLVFEPTLGETTTALTSSANPSVLGQSLTLTAKVNIESSGSGTPTGTVTFFDGTTSIGNGALISSQATLTISSLSVGSHSITAQYNGDSKFELSTSPVITLIIESKPTTSMEVSVSSEPESVKPDEPSTITVTVTGTDDKPISGADVKLTANIGSVNPTSGTTDSFGEFTSIFKSSTEGTATIKVRVIKDGFSETSGKTEIKVESLTGPSVLVSSEPESVEPDNISTIIVTVTGTDGKGISGANVILTTDIGKVNPVSGTTDSSGKFTSTFTSSTIGTATIKAKVKTGDISDATGETGVQVQSLTNLKVLVSPRTESVKIDEKSTITVTVTGDDGNGVSGASVELKTNTGKLYKASGTTNSQGDFTSTFTPSEEGTAIITAQVTKDDLNASGKTSIEVNPEFPYLPILIAIFALAGIVILYKLSKDNNGKKSASLKDEGAKKKEETNILELPEPSLNLQIEPESILADGKSTATATIKLQDEKGKAISFSNERIVELSIDLGTISGPTKILPGETKVTATITAGQKPGTSKIGVTLSPAEGEGKTLRITGEIVFTQVEPSDAELDVQIEPESIPADGKSTATVTIRIKDEKGNFVPSCNGKIIELSTDFGTITSPVKMLPGETAVTATIISAQRPGDSKVEASSKSSKEKGKSLHGTGKIVFTQVEPSEAELYIQIEPESIPADGKSTATVTIRIKDEKGNFVPSCNGKIIELSTDFGTITSPVKMLPGETTVTATITSAQKPGDSKVEASSKSSKEKGKSLHGTGKIVFTQVEPSEVELEVQIEPESIPADGKSTATVTIRIKDEKGNFVPSCNGKIIELSTDFGTITSPVKMLPGETAVTATITSAQKPGTAKIGVTLSPAEGEGKTLRVTGEIVFTQVEPSEVELDVQIEPESIPADGKSTAKVTIRIKDEKGNFVPSCNGKIIELSTDFGTITSPVKMLPGETAVTATITSAQKPGNVKVIASSSPYNGEGKSLSAEGKIMFKESEEVGLDIQIEHDSILADGKSTAEITIRIKDDKGNFIPSRDEKIVELSTTLGKVTSHVKIPSGATEGNATITSGRVVGTAIVTASSSPLTGEGKSLHGEAKFVLSGLVPEESGPDGKNTP